MTPDADTDRRASIAAGPAHAWAVPVSWALAILGVLLQVSYPLLDGEALRLVTIGSVVALAAAALAHAAALRGLAWALGLLAIAAGAGFAAEAVGVASGWPFGGYDYTASLGARALGVPLVVPLAWLMTAYPCLLAGRAITPTRWAWLPAAWILASWDLFLDPQMVAAGHWTWSDPTPALPGIEEVPLTNFAGWLLVSAVIMLLLDRLPRRHDDGHPPRDAMPAALLGWLWASQVLANLVFFDRPGVAAWGGAAMGVPLLLYVLALRRTRRPPPASDAMRRE